MFREGAIGCDKPMKPTRAEGDKGCSAAQKRGRADWLRRPSVCQNKKKRLWREKHGCCTGLRGRERRENDPGAESYTDEKTSICREGRSKRCDGSDLQRG